jgi:DNA polymerase V
MVLEKFIPIKEEKVSPQGDPVDAVTSACEKEEPFVLMVLGDSMLPEFVEGEVIVIEPELPPQDGSYVIAQHKGEYTFRQLIQRQGKWYLHALNENYSDDELEGLECVRGVISQKKGPGRNNRKTYL